MKLYPSPKVLSFKKKTVECAADPWRGWGGAADGAAVPVSGVCASAASIWAQRGFFVVGGWKHVSGLHLIG